MTMMVEKWLNTSGRMPCVVDTHSQLALAFKVHSVIASKALMSEAVHPWLPLHPAPCLLHACTKQTAHAQNKMILHDEVLCCTKTGTMSNTLHVQWPCMLGWPSGTLRRSGDCLSFHWPRCLRLSWLACYRVDRYHMKSSSTAAAETPKIILLFCLSAITCKTTRSTTCQQGPGPRHKFACNKGCCSPYTSPP